MNKNKIYNTGKVLALIAFGLAAKLITKDGPHNHCMLPLLLAAGGVAASVLGKGKKASAPPPPVSALGNKAKIAKRYASNLFNEYYPTAIPLALQTSAQYGPQIMGQMFDQTGQFLGGVNGQPGFQALQLSTGREAGNILGQLREEELAQMTGQTGMTRGLMAALSPEQAAAVQGSAQEAARARASAQGVTPEEQRMYQQTAREGAQAAGRLGGNSAIAAEIMGRENVMAQKRAEAAQAEKQSYALAGEFYTNPGLQALRNAPLSYGAGQQDLRTALTLGPASSGDFDYNMPLNFAQQAAGAQNQYNQAVYQTNLANQQAKAQMWSSIGSSMMGAGMNMAGGGFNFGGAGGGAGMQTAQSPWGNVRYSYT
jgi:hypothetical protein